MTPTTRLAAIAVESAVPITKPLSTERRFGGALGRRRQRLLDAPAQAQAAPKRSPADAIASLHARDERETPPRNAHNPADAPRHRGHARHRARRRAGRGAGFRFRRNSCPCIRSSAIQALRSMQRARASRDITVPTGTPTTSAISRYDKSLISRSTIASRNGSGSSATSRRIVSASHWRIIAASGEAGGSCHSGDGLRHPLVRPPSAATAAPERRANSAATDVAQDGEQPRLHLRAAIAVEMAQRAQIAFLHGIFGIGGVAEQISRQRVDVVEMRAARRRENAAPCHDDHRCRFPRCVAAWLSRRCRQAKSSRLERALLRRVAAGRRFDHDSSRHVRMQGAEILVRAGRREREREFVLRVERLRLEELARSRRPCAGCRRA